MSISELFAWVHACWWRLTIYILTSTVSSDLDSPFISLRWKYGKQLAPTEAEGPGAAEVCPAKDPHLFNHKSWNGSPAQGLMEGMYLGYYVLDIFKVQSFEDECS
jgi:hypothetical protein